MYHHRVPMKPARARVATQPNSRRGLLLSVIAVAALLWALFATVQLASAHVEFESAEPAPDSVVADAPTEIRVVFDGEIMTEGSSIQVVGLDNEALPTEEAELDLDDLDRQTLALTLPEDLPDGVYTVRYAGAPTDGHEPTEGTFTFTIGEADTATPVATPFATPFATPGATPEVEGAAGSTTTGDENRGFGNTGLLVALVIVVIGSSFMRRRRMNQMTSGPRR